MFLNGEQIGDSLDFFSGRELSSMLDNLRRQFDIVIFDAPPLLTDSSTLAARVFLQR